MEMASLATLKPIPNRVLVRGIRKILLRDQETQKKDNRATIQNRIHSMNQPTIRNRRKVSLLIPNRPNRKLLQTKRISRMQKTKIEIELHNRKARSARIALPTQIIENSRHKRGTGETPPLRRNRP